MVKNSTTWSISSNHSNKYNTASPNTDRPPNRQVRKSKITNHHHIKGQTDLQIQSRTYLSMLELTVHKNKKSIFIQSKSRSLPTQSAVIWSQQTLILKIIYTIYTNIPYLKSLKSKHKQTNLTIIQPIYTINKNYCMYIQTPSRIIH